MYVASYDISCMPDVVEPASRMAAFRLNNPVDTFRNGIVGGFADGTFRPKNTTSAQEASGYASATRQQALVIAVRMAEKLG